MAEYLSQSAVLRSGLSGRAQKALTERLGGKPIEQVYMAQRKYDGASGIVHTLPESAHATTRVGTVLTTVDHVVDACMYVFGHDYVVFGEFWMPTVEQATITGKVMRIAPAPELQFVVFDVVSRYDYEQGYTEDETSNFRSRYNFLLSKMADYNGKAIFACPTYNPGTYGTPEQFCTTLLEMGGYDGVILRDPESPWLPGKDKHGYVIKVKQVLEYDLEVTAVEEGLGRNAGRLGALVVRFKGGKLLRVSGMGDDLRKSWWDDPSLVVGKIIEVHAVALSSNGLLREPRFKGIRHDKDQADF